MFQAPQTPAFSEHFVERGQGRVYARDYAGAEPAFVMMHGFPDNLHIYDYLVPCLVAAGRRVVTFDFLGFGRSDKPEGGDYSFAQQLGDLVAVCDHLKLGPIVPVAHDAAGGAGINFAIDHPERTASLVILNCGFDDTVPVVWPELITIFADPDLKGLAMSMLQSPETLGWLLKFQQMAFYKALPERYQERFKDFLGPVIDANFRSQPSAARAFAVMASQFFAELARNTPRLAKLEVLDLKAKIIWGDADPYIGVAVAQNLKAHLNEATLNFLPAGHWLQIDEPESVAALMLEA